MKVAGSPRDAQRARSESLRKTGKNLLPAWRANSSHGSARVSARSWALCKALSMPPSRRLA